jgi:hypothetical protein
VLLTSNLTLNEAPHEAVLVRHLSVATRLVGASGSRKFILRIEKTIRFDDVDHDAGYEYRGFDYVIRSEMDEFLVRIYDSDPGKAAVIRPTFMFKNCNLRMLIDFLKIKLGASSISVYKREVGTYEEIDLDRLIFQK